MTRFTTSDSKAFEVAPNIVKHFKTIEIMIECLGEDAAIGPIPLKQIDSIIFGIVLKWAEHHQNDKTPDAEQTVTTQLSDFDREFIIENGDNLFEIINAANFLGFEQLFAELCKHLASELSGKSPDEIRKEFKILEKEPKLN